LERQRKKPVSRKGKNDPGSVLISERGIYAASPFKAIMALKRTEARAPSASQDTAMSPVRLPFGGDCANL
jgi:hypothetical protein